MSKAKINKEFTTQLKDEQFLYFADNSNIGILLIQRGHLKYFNKRFAEIFGYNEDEIVKWKKREFYKIVHPDDLSHLIHNFKVEDSKTISIRFRGVAKDKKVIKIENYVCIIKYNNKKAFLSSYTPLEEPYEEETYAPKIIRLKTLKRIVLDYHPKTIKILEDNDLNYNIYKSCSYREEG